MFMQTRGLVTAAEVAEELEVSTRTARRDLDALAMSGVPIYSQPGRGGGWRLVGGARTDLTGLSSAEARAVFLALGHQRDANPVLEAALRKLVVAIPEGFRDDAVAATTAIRVDPSGWGHIGPVHREEFVDLLSDAVITARQAEIRYATPGKPAAERIVHPLGLVTKRGVWYLIANTDKGIRTFRLSRIERAKLLDGSVDRPDDFDLDATWERIVSHVEQQRAELHVRVKVQPDKLRPIQYVFSNRHDILGETSDGWIEMMISEVSAEAFAGQIAGFGAGVELLDPPVEVVEALTQIAAELGQVWLRS